MHILVRQGERQRKEVCVKDIFVLYEEKKPSYDFV